MNGLFIIALFCVAIYHGLTVAAWLHPETLDKHRRGNMVAIHAIMATVWVLLGTFALLLL